MIRLLPPGTGRHRRQPPAPTHTGTYPTRVTVGPSPGACVHAATPETLDGHTRRTACGRTFITPYREYTHHSQKRLCAQCRAALENPPCPA